MEYWKVKIFNNNVKVAQTFGKTPDEALRKASYAIDGSSIIRKRRERK